MAFAHLPFSFTFRSLNLLCFTRGSEGHPFAVLLGGILSRKEPFDCAIANRSKHVFPACLFAEFDTSVISMCLYFAVLLQDIVFNISPGV